MKMKKLTLIVAVMLAACLTVQAVDEWTGTRVGNAVIADGVAGAVAIGDGATGGVAVVRANGAGQIGPGSNTVANTLKFRDKYVVLNSTNSSGAAEIDAAELVAGTTASAINGASITNVVAANIRAGGTLPAITAGSTLGVTGVATFRSNIVTVVGSTTYTNFNGQSAVSAMPGAATVAGTLDVTGIASFTASPRFNAALGTPGTQIGMWTNLPAGCSTNAKWIVVYGPNGYTNYVPAFQF
jgi:hypothetical protein